MINLPNLPLPGNKPDGKKVSIHIDDFGRWKGVIWDEGFKIDEFYGYNDPFDLLMSIADEYLGAAFVCNNPYFNPDASLDTNRQKEIRDEKTQEQFVQSFREASIIRAQTNRKNRDRNPRRVVGCRTYSNSRIARDIKSSQRSDQRPPL